MSRQPQAVSPVPEDTARVARAAFPKGNASLRMHDEWGRLSADRDVAARFPTRGQPALAPAQLALVTLMPSAEGRPDRQAAEAVRGRIDREDARCLELDDPGFDYSVFGESCARLLAHEQEGPLFDLLPARCREAGLVRARGRQRTDSTRVLAAIRDRNRLELVGETLRHARHALASVVPGWLRQRCPAEWATRYGRRLHEYRLPQELAARLAPAIRIGADGRRLLGAVRSPGAPDWPRAIPAVETLRHVRVRHFHAPDDGGTPGWRADGELPPCAVRIASPHDPEARFAAKRETGWTGYKVDLTEACEPDAPLLIALVRTTTATAADRAALAPIHRGLAAAQPLPYGHLVDAGDMGAGDMDADNLVDRRQDHGVARVGPPPGNTHRRARTAGAFDVDGFALDREARRATGPQGHVSGRWSETTDPLGNAVITTHFAPADCLARPCRARCTRSVRGPRRRTLRPQAQHPALRAARARPGTPGFAAQYAPRAASSARARTSSCTARVTATVSGVTSARRSAPTAASTSRPRNRWHGGVPRATPSRWQT